jgi:16S rRNA (uracil1498-N3)-methyltransferase
MQLFYLSNLLETNYLGDEESHHAIRVLRFQVGTNFFITNGKGTRANVQASKIEGKKLYFTIINSSFTENIVPDIHLAIAPTKNQDKMEWLVEKATEIGIRSVRFMQCEQSERKELKLERLEKIAISAMKQSKQDWLPILHPMEKFGIVLEKTDNFEQKFMCYVDPENTAQLAHSLVANKSTLVLVGPEGDFTEKELAFAQKIGFQKVALGNTVLRTETAGLVACQLMNNCNL